MTVVTFGGLTFNDEASTGFTLSGLEGWYSGAPSRRSVRERPLADGAFGVSRYYRGARVITVEGSYVGSSIADAYAARDSLASLQSDGLSSPFVVTDALGVRACSVELITAPTPDDDLYSPFFKWSFDVVASDPSKYGPAVVTSTGLPTSGTGIAYPIAYPISYGTPGNSGRLVVSNPGTRESFSLLSVTGGLGGFTVQNVASGQVLRFDRDVPVGGTVFLNPRTRRAYLDVPANDVTGFLSVRDWWMVAAGASFELQFNSIGTVTGSPLLSASTQPAY